MHWTLSTLLYALCPLPGPQSRKRLHYYSSSARILSPRPMRPSSSSSFAIGLSVSFLRIPHPFIVQNCDFSNTSLNRRHTCRLRASCETIRQYRKT
ncbi:hypothetical protein BDN70DRAFT_494391 [Pholiota conissans]|uniref:Uncharacterized protein n=1 Tax=Pholiota conissans TaxID=109636 RepID=A0A9P6CTL3_9AGAR|nr:hypothetical protein BDN70DRAFT_494391 [Pholiota conissans]